MKKVLIIEDDQIVANIYRNKLAVEGYQVEVNLDGEGGLRQLRLFRPDLVVLDLILPKMSGVEVIREIRSDGEFSKLPIIVFSNTYLTNLVQDAWKAGASKCVSKINCPPKELLELIRHSIGTGAPVTHAAKNGSAATAQRPSLSSSDADAAFLAELQAAFVAGLPGILHTLRSGLQSLIKADTETTRLKHIHEIYRRVHAVNGNAGVAGLTQIANMAAALEALLKELYEKPKNINTSTLRTVATAVDFLGFLFERGIRAEKKDFPPASVLVVDDEAISRRAVVYALEKAHLKPANVEDPNEALNLLADKSYDLIFLDVNMPGMSGYELCAKLRALPFHKKTPVVFVTALSDFDNRASSMMAGGSDFIAKPFLFIELTVKALIHILRGKLQTAK